MSERNWGKALFGGIIGLILGVVLGIHRVTEVAAEQGTAAPSTSDGVLGVDPAFILHSPRFWIVLVICTVAFAFIAGRIGRPTHHADL